LHAMFGRRQGGMPRLSVCMNAASLGFGWVLHRVSLI
jgi:hypothetical protein